MGVYWCSVQVSIVTEGQWVPGTLSRFVNRIWNLRNVWLCNTTIIGLHLFYVLKSSIFISKYQSKLTLSGSILVIMIILCIAYNKTYQVFIFLI